MLYTWITTGQLRKYITPKGIRKIARSNLRREDDAIQDIKTLGVKNWMNLAMQKERWQKLLRKARAHVGLSSR
jgi:hypothetical protein